VGLQRRLARVVVSSSWSRARTQSRIVLYRRCQCTATDRADDGVAIEDIMSSLTCRMFAAMEGSETEGVFSAGASTSYDAFCRLDAAWEDMKTRRVYGLPPKTVRTTVEGLPACPGIDVIVGGGTLGIFVAMALQKRGLRTAVIDRGMVCGRDQDWNVSREELGALVRCGVLTQDEVNDSVTVEFNPIKAGFDGYDDVSTVDVLNVGVSPRRLIDHVRKAYTACGGLVLEKSRLDTIWVHPNGISLRYTDSEGNRMALAGKLFIDSMGNQSPIVKQVLHGKKPDGVCLVVGSCARGFEDNSHGDIIRTISPSLASDGRHDMKNVQMFWEAFPAGSGPTDRTTYMFSYMDASESRPSFFDMMEHYWHEMPRYQGINLEDIQVQRILFGLFPTYKDSPLPPQFDRILAVGDASGMQSPLSFGGFTALTRHIGRLTDAVTEAVEADCLDRWSLKYVNPYNPSLSSAWMFQKAMSIPSNATKANISFINRLLGNNFQIMAEQPHETILKPFLQDVIIATPLTETLVRMMTQDPLFVPVIMSTVGLPALVEWVGHYVLLVVYTVVSQQAERYHVEERIQAHVKDPKRKFILHRALERWKYGSGLDYYN
jgi:flavin-dependent dehydrogenase